MPPMEFREAPEYAQNLDGLQFEVRAVDGGFKNVFDEVDVKKHFTCPYTCPRQSRKEYGSTNNRVRSRVFRFFCHGHPIEIKNPWVDSRRGHREVHKFLVIFAEKIGLCQ